MSESRVPGGSVRAAGGGIEESWGGFFFNQDKISENKGNCPRKSPTLGHKVEN